MNSFRIGGVIGILLALACFWYWHSESSKADELDKKVMPAEAQKSDTKPAKSSEDHDKAVQVAKDARGNAQNGLIFGVVLGVLGAGLILAPRFQRKPPASSP